MSSRLAVARNLLKALLLLAGLCGLWGATGWLLGGYRLLILFAAAAFLLAGAVYWYGDRFVLGMLGSRELPLAAAPMVHSTVERLAARAGVAKPKLHLLPDGHPRAFVVGRGPLGSTIAVSQGLLAAAPPAELEGVL